MGKKIASGNVEMQRSIDASVVTDLVVDQSGVPHLTSKDSGEDIVSLVSHPDLCRCVSFV